MRTTCPQAGGAAATSEAIGNNAVIGRGVARQTNRQRLLAAGRRSTCRLDAPTQRAAGDVRARAVEDDPRYRRVDHSAQHAHESRQAFAAELARGEGGVNLAAAALHVAAEDDALVSHSTVRLPVPRFQQRIRALATDVRRRLQAMPRTPEAEVYLQAVHECLFGDGAFCLPQHGRSAVPAHSLVDHPGVWENPAQAYLNEVLIRRVGIPASLAIVYAQVMQELLLGGGVNFAVRIDCSRMNELPVARILHGIPPEALLRPDGSVLNTCSTDALVEMLRFLKRAFWPFPWQTTGGGEAAPEHAGGSGFRGAAEVALKGVGSADLEAISRTAKHRLDRGIWTSTGAGDLRRARAAAERLCLLVGEEAPWERRDAGVLLLHAGAHGQAAAELGAYQASRHFRDGAPLEERGLVERLLALLRSQPGFGGGCEPLSIEGTLAQAPPQEAEALPLTW